jgi:hypothetical protein
MKGREVRVMANKGRPRTFKDEKDFLNKFNAYIDYCRAAERFPNIAGFCSYLLITRDTFYAQQEYYSDTYNIVNAILEDEVLQHNTYMAQLYLKNKCGYKDKVEMDNNIGNKDGKEFKVDFSHLSVEQIKELLKNEDKG